MSLFERIDRWASTPGSQGLITGLVLVGLAVALLAASGCRVGGEDHPTGARPPEALDDPGRAACAEFARWLTASEKPATRPAVAREVHLLSSNSQSGALDDKGELLFRVSLRRSDENWALAADAFSYECYVLGWASLKP